MTEHSAVTDDFAFSDRHDGVLTVAERAPRPNVMLMAIVEHSRWSKPTKHRVRDLSAGGARIDDAEKMLAGDTLRVSIGAAHQITATVKWVRLGSAGLCFNDEVDLNEARKNVAAAPKSRTSSKGEVPFSAPKAGWFSSIKDPYRD